MGKIGVIVATVVVAIVIAAGVSYLLSGTDDMDTYAPRQHGEISTAMGSPILGDSSAPITIIEFGDYQCHACHAWFLNTAPAIKQDYIDTGMANLIFVDLAFLGRDSPRAAQASYCAEDQGMYWQYHNTLYSNQEEKIDSWASTERLRAFAFSIGMDMELFDECMNSDKHAKRVQYNVRQAEQSGANSTPTFFIIGPEGQQEKIVGAQPYVIFKQVLDSMI